MATSKTEPIYEVGDKYRVSELMVSRQAELVSTRAVASRLKPTPEQTEMIGQALQTVRGLADRLGLLLSDADLQRLEIEVTMAITDNGKE